MRHSDFPIFLINPPHTAIGSRMPREQLPPLGLLSIGGPLIDAGFPVQLLDAEFGPLTVEQITAQVARRAPRMIMIGHAGSSSAHPTAVRIAAAIKAMLPGTIVVYGGVHPTYHWEEILNRDLCIDYVVRGEGERTAVLLATALASKAPLVAIDGIAFRWHGRAFATPEAEMIADLDQYRVGWELIDHARYSYWGGKRAVVVQFSRGCPHLCSYCGQRGFWTRWRHRDPVKFAKELARLHREQGVELVNFADELPTGSRKAWKAFLEALIAENVPLLLVGSTRAGDIVRDADILRLYKQAGVIRFLLGIESYDQATLNAIKKGATMSEDREAIRLMRLHGIISLATYVVGFEEETDADYWRSLKHLLRYDPDQIQMIYVTPHRWTPYYPTVASRRVIQTDQRKWDYKHQVLATRHVPPWRVFLWVKAIELCMQTRPRAILRTFFSRDPDVLHGMRWYVRIGRRVWFHEVANFLFGDKRVAGGPSVAQFMGESLHEREEALRVCSATRRRDIPIAKVG
ncbi:MAG TPA: magnesium-protoporphyrin IX monomethyl ester anaerobic oxidative cyclase [Burkholderiaceae bacterium]